VLCSFCFVLGFYLFIYLFIYLFFANEAEVSFTSKQGQRKKVKKSYTPVDFMCLFVSVVACFQRMNRGNARGIS
jgi:hypothetical protein